MVVAAAAPTSATAPPPFAHLSCSPLPCLPLFTPLPPPALVCHLCSCLYLSPHLLICTHPRSFVLVYTHLNGLGLCLCSFEHTCVPACTFPSACPLIPTRLCLSLLSPLPLFALVDLVAAPLLACPGLCIKYIVSTSIIATLLTFKARIIHLNMNHLLVFNI